MLKLTLSPDLRQRMGRAGQERVRQYFDWERKVDRIIEIYDSTRAASINQCKAFGFPTGN
jgi:Glycosyltransferase